ncbi:cell wall hydrolase [Shimazuella kribbensis]|uniref:cell wall hydrolase n=1 Tax=Shimazuella kribbensis TaxID=139808 RepID=UPI00041CF14F|nr:cell wall hydrolase [Shimazuella kribbensis]
MLISKYILVLSSFFSFIFVSEQGPQLTSASIHTKAEKSTQVKDAQLRLKKLGLYKKPISQVYDAYTRNVIAQFQTNNHLPINGTLDSKTTGKLQQLTTVKQVKPAKAVKKSTPVKAKPEKKNHSVKSQSVDATQAEVRLLAKAVHSEARGEKFTGKVAVAAVILNRTETKGFPHTIKGVIYEPKAFTAVSDGQFSLKPSTEAYRAAYAALRGSDPTSGAVFYFNPEIATSSWMKQEARKHDTVKIGRHVFFK